MTKKLTTLVVRASLCLFGNKLKPDISDFNAWNRTFISIISPLFLNHLRLSNKRKVVCRAVGLILFLFNSISVANAQEQVKALGIGDSLPKNFWQMEHEVYQNGKLIKQNLSAYKGKLMILDFWATWCSPCVAMIPKMDSLQQKFGNQVQLISITYQSGNEILPFLEKLNKNRESAFKLPFITADQELRKYFPHIYLPHYVWIDEKGVVSAFSDYLEINEGNIRTAIQKNEFRFKSKTDQVNQKYDFNDPLFEGNTQTDSILLFRSFFSRYKAGLPGAYQISPYGNKQVKVTVTNYSILSFFKMAFGENKIEYRDTRVALEVQHPEYLENTKDKGQPYTDWKAAGNSFCYEMVADLSLGLPLYKFLQREFADFFRQYIVSLEKRKTRCYVLEIIPGAAKFQSNGEQSIFKLDRFKLVMQNIPLQRLTYQLSATFLQGSMYPVIDHTNYSGNATLTLNADLSKIEDLNKALSIYGLRFTVKDMPIDILVIRDRKINSESIKQK